MNDWKERLAILKEIGAKIFLYASANTLDEEKIKYMKENGVYNVFMGLEDISKSYPKNAEMDTFCELLHKHGIHKMLSFIVGPLTLDTDEQITEYFTKLAKRLS